MKHVFIVNPVSGKGKGLIALAEMGRIFEEQKLPFSFSLRESLRKALSVSSFFSDISITSRTCLTMVFGTIPLSMLY